MDPRRVPETSRPDLTNGTRFKPNTSPLSSIENQFTTIVSAKRNRSAVATGRYPNGFLDFLEFLCTKYGVDRTTIFVEFNPNPPPILRGNIPGYYDGLLSHRERNGRSEFLITVFEIARNPLLTLGHEFAHLVEDLAKGARGNLAPPDEAREKRFDRVAMRDLEEFRSSQAK